MFRPPVPQLVSAVLVGALALTSCTGPADERSPSTAPAASDLTAVTGAPRAAATGLTAAWSVVFRDGTALISERDSGRILELLDDGSTREIGTVPGVVASGEGGLLGLAVDDRDRLFVFSVGEGGSRIQRFAVSGDAGSLSLGSPVTILDELPSARNHDGGRIAFGPDGMLYATVGDAGERSAAQDLDVLAGKILRMSPDGEAPGDNPYPGSLVYSYGHRNPQGIAWADDGTMFATEFGQDTWDELNIITPGGNYGWPDEEGIAGVDGYIDPVQQWTPDEASPSGMTYIGGTLYIANLRGEVLRAVPASDPATRVDFFIGEYGRLRDVTVAPDGTLWFVTNNTDGRGEAGPDDDRILSVDLADD